jgi:hypothetical protein
LHEVSVPNLNISVHAACPDNLNLDLTNFEALEDRCLLERDTMHTMFRVEGGATFFSETMVTARLNSVISPL